MNSILTVRVKPETKKAAQKTLRELELDLSSSVNMFLEQIVATDGIPFAPVTKKGLKLRHRKIYRKEINWALKHGKSYKTAEEAFSDIFKR